VLNLALHTEKKISMYLIVTFSNGSWIAKIMSLYPMHIPLVKK